MFNLKNLKIMQKLSLKNATNTLSRKEMRSISGGYSKLYCYYHSTTVKVFGIVLHDQHLQYDACRKM